MQNLNRRKFFKDAITKVLPMIGILTCAPLKTLSAPLLKDGCNGSCKSTCYKGCKTSCKFMCDNGCKSECKSGCKKKCNHTCAIACGGACSATCKHTARVTNDTIIMKKDTIV